MNNVPNMKLSQQAIALRIRENKWDALDRALNDLFMDLDHEVNIPMLCDAIQAALTSRMGLIDDCSNEHDNLQQDVNNFNALGFSSERNYAQDGIVTRTAKHECLKIALSNIGVAK